jgi:hypothetical protein
MMSPLFRAAQSTTQAQASGAPGRLHPPRDLMGWNILHFRRNLLDSNSGG